MRTLNKSMVGHKRTSSSVNERPRKKESCGTTQWHLSRRYSKVCLKRWLFCRLLQRVGQRTNL